jgi:hypothetical protein
MRTTNRLRLAAWVLLTLGAGTAWSQAKAGGEATLGGGSGSGPMLTREQLRQCLVEQDELKQATGALASEQKQIDDEKQTIQKADAELKEQLAQLDRTNAEAVQAHVAKAREHDQRVDGYNAKLKPFNERAAALQKRGGDWKAACADRRYKEDDLLLLQGRKQVPK